MSGTRDRLKGRIEETAGAATDDPDLRREGRADQAAGEVKDAAGEAASKVEGGVARIVDRVRNRR